MTFFLFKNQAILCLKMRARVSILYHLLLANSASILVLRLRFVKTIRACVRGLKHTNYTFSILNLVHERLSFYDSTLVNCIRQINRKIKKNKPKQKTKKPRKKTPACIQQIFHLTYCYLFIYLFIIIFFFHLGHVYFCIVLETKIKFKQNNRDLDFHSTILKYNHYK